jgi:hypothetical protein
VLAPPGQLVRRVLREDNPRADRRETKHSQQERGPPGSGRHPEIDLAANDHRAEGDIPVATGPRGASPPYRDADSPLS